MYDLIIIGGGPAAISAGIYAARKKIKTLIIAKNFGGQIIWSPKVDNYLGIPDISGIDLTKKFTEHLKKFEIEIEEGKIVTKIKKEKDIFNIIIGKPSPQPSPSSRRAREYQEYQAKSVLIATGKSPRRLDVPGTEKFEGKGIVYCATCDAPLFKNKIVAVVGSGDSALYTTWDLTKYADKIFIFNKYEQFKSNNPRLIDDLSKNSKIEIIFNALVKKINGDKFVNGLVYEQGGNEKEIKIEGIFVTIGSTPNSKFAENIVQLNEKKEIIIDCKTNQTTASGIFAAGDVTNIAEKQIIIAAAEGAKAVLNIATYLKNHFSE